MEEFPMIEPFMVACRRASLKRRILPTLAGAALRDKSDKGVEALFDAIVNFPPLKIKK